MYSYPNGQIIPQINDKDYLKSIPKALHQLHERVTELENNNTKETPMDATFTKKDWKAEHNKLRGRRITAKAEGIMGQVLGCIDYEDERFLIGVVKIVYLNDILN